MTIETKQIKNKIILFTGIGAYKKKVELINFNCIDHTWKNSVSFIHIACGNKNYYYQTHITVISCIYIYE